MKETSKQKRRNENGYTLISLAVSLIIIGLLLAAGGQIYATYLEHKRITLNNERVNNAINQIQIFRQVNNRYPCPSSLTANRNAPAYGFESPTDCTNAAPAPVIPAGSCNNGVCVVNGDPTRIAVAPTVRIGALPFRALQMDEKETYDAYGSRLYYAVTERLAVENTFNEINGGINIVDENGNSVLNPVGSASFVVVSPGPNKVGAYSVEGTQAIACPDLAIVGSPLESSNCVDTVPVPPVILGQTGVTAAATFASSYAALAGGAGNFDDTIDFFSSLQDPLWKRTTANNNNIEALITSGVGAGVSGPTQTLDISTSVYTAGGGGVGQTWDGGLRVSSLAANSSLQANQFCDYNGANCFDLASITGDNTAGEGMKCANPNEYMVGIENGAAKCAPVRVYCPPASNPTKTVLNGLNADGSPNCVAPNNNCLAGNVQLCNTGGFFDPRNSNQAQTNSTSITSGVHGANQTITDFSAFTFAANNKKAQFTCNNGVWQYTADISGFCGSSCTIPAWAGPGPTYSGTNVVSGTVNCAGAMSGVTTTTTTTYTFSLATCTTPSSSATAACNCAGYFPVVAGAPTTGPSLNPPPAQPAPALGSCGAGFNTGGTSTPYIWDSSDAVCNWKPGAPTSTCACNPALAGAVPVGATVACNTLPGHAGDGGTATEIWTFDPSTSGAHACQYYKSGYDTTACTCDTSTEHASSSGHASTCNTVCDNESPSAVWVFKYTGAGCTAGADYIKTAATASAKPFKWISQGVIASISAGSAGTMPQCGDTCRTSSVGSCMPVGTPATFTSPSVTPGGAACPEMNSTGSCWTSSGGIYYSNFAKCM